MKGMASGNESDGHLSLYPCHNTHPLTGKILESYNHCKSHQAADPFRIPRLAIEMQREGTELLCGEGVFNYYRTAPGTSWTWTTLPLVDRIYVCQKQL